MSLFSSLNLARLALGAHQTAIQTVGQNIANAASEGYARQRVQMTPTPSDDLVFARIGTGVRVERIERIVDEHLEATLRDSRSDLANLGEQDRIWSFVESIFDDLEGGGLSEALGAFFDAVQDLTLDPQDPTTRSLLLREGETLADTLRFLDGRIRDLRAGLDEDIQGSVLEVNRLTTELAALNRAIIEAEDGGVHGDSANDLRTRRDALLGQLAELVDIRVFENSSGGVQVLAGSEMLVHDGRSRDLSLVPASDGDISLHRVRFADDGALLAPTGGGRIAALLAGRDAVLPDLRGELDAIAGRLIAEVNAVHSQGEGLARLSAVVSGTSVVDRDQTLSAAGLPSAVEAGGFTIQVVTEGNGARESFRVAFDPATTSLAALADLVNLTAGASHPEIVASVTADGRLEIRSTDPAVTFTFRDDDSGALAALGVNGFFAGADARTIAVSQALVDDPSLVAAGRGGGPGDNTGALALAALRDATLFATGAGFEGHYQALIGEIGVHAREARDLLANQAAITEAVTNQRESLSGVNLDEEAISLMAYQRAYQASARFLGVIDRLLDTLLNAV